MSREQIRANDLAQLKGASAWLTTLPLKSEGYVLNKREFFDALALRYRWRLKYLPTRCVCGKPFSMDHAMQCLNGGYVNRRHNQIRDIFAKLLDEVAYGVEIEPRLQPLSGEVLPAGANEKIEARLDFAGKGFWQQCEMAYFDVNPVCIPRGSPVVNSTWITRGIQVDFETSHPRGQDHVVTPSQTPHPSHHLHIVSYAYHK